MFRAITITVVAALAAAALSCGSDDDAGADDRRSTVPRPLVEGPVSGGSGSPWIQATSFPLAEVGYEGDEYFISGAARRFVNLAPLDSDGVWTAEAGGMADYATRIVVYRPIDAADYSGVVIVEWLNVSGGLDAAPDWTAMHTEIIREGHVWVGVSAQFVGVEGGGSIIPGLPDLSLKTADPDRYGSLLHPGDSYSYDIFSQAGQALRAPDGVDPINGWPIDRLIAVGESQSAFRLVTYLNAIHPLSEMYDAYLVHSRGGSAASLSQEPEPAIPVPSVVRIREDVGVPVLTFQTETDLFLLGFFPDRQPDSRWHRLWEVAGTAHADTYTLTRGMSDRGGDPSVYDLLVTAEPIPGIIECDLPINDGPQHVVLKAALEALIEWARTGEAPPSAPRLEIAGDPADFVVDDLGNTAGGIRTSAVDAPIATLLGEGQEGGGFCFLFGTTIPFDDETLAELYPTHDDYVAAVEEATEAAVAAGHVLEEEAALIVESARGSDIGG